MTIVFLSGLNLIRMSLVVSLFLCFPVFDHNSAKPDTHLIGEDFHKRGQGHLRAPPGPFCGLARRKTNFMKMLKL